MHCDIDHAGFDLLLRDRRNEIRDTFCNLDTARRNARKDNGIEFRIRLDDFVRDAPQRTLNGFRIQNRSGARS